MQSKAKKQKKRTARRRRKASSRNSLVGMNFSPLKPAGISMKKRRSKYRFFSGTRPENLGMEATFPMYTISANTNPTVGVTTYNNFVGNPVGPSGTNRASFLVLNALGGIGYQEANLIAGEVAFNYVAPTMQFMSLNFVHYRMHELEFIYEPQSTTTTDDRLVFGFASDALHPLLKNSDGTQDISSKILALEDSVAFAPWESWRMDVSNSLNKENLYVYDPVLTGGVTNQDQQYTARQVNRFSAFGCIAASASNTSTVQSQKIYGILYARIKVEYIEYCPIYSGLVTNGLTVQSPSSKSVIPLLIKEEKESIKVETKIEEMSDSDSSESEECDCKTKKRNLKISKF